MSFKRDGNDSSLLSKLRKRRINELFGENIPKDEAKLLSNGRFTCTVCHSNPIFDTVQMLVVHRNGRKHLANLQTHELKKRELKELIAVRKHQQFLREGTTSIPVASTSSDGVLLSAPYDSRVKKAKLGSTERKLRVDFQARSVDEEPKYIPASPHTFTSEADSTLVSGLPGSSTPPTSMWQHIADQQISGPVMHDHQLKNLFVPNKNMEDRKVYPYQKKRNCEAEHAGCTILDKTVRHSQHGQHPSSSHMLIRSSHSLSLSKSTTEPHRAHVTVSTFKKTSPFVQASVSSKAKDPSILPPAPSPQQQLEQASDPHSHPQSRDSKKNSAQVQLSQKLRQLQGSGWKRDWDGKWIKDENAEFDSDEEPPDIP